MSDPRDDVLSPDDAALIASALEPVAPAPGRAEALKAGILARVRQEGRQGAGPSAVVPAAEAQAGFFTVHARDRQWQKVAPGVEMCTLHEDEDRRSILVRVEPGGYLLPHHHEMSEESLLLEGDAWIDKDTYLTPGDYHFSPAGRMHPLLESPQGCVVFVRCERKFRPRITTGLISRLLRGSAPKPPE